MRFIVEEAHLDLESVPLWFQECPIWRENTIYGKHCERNKAFLGTYL